MFLSMFSFSKNLLSIAIIAIGISSAFSMTHGGDKSATENSSSGSLSPAERQSTVFQRVSKFPEDIQNNESIALLPQGDIRGPLRFLDEAKYWKTFRYSLISLKTVRYPSSIVVLFSDLSKRINQFWAASYTSETLYIKEGEVDLGELQETAKKSLALAKANITIHNGILLSDDEKLMDNLKDAFSKELPTLKMETALITSDQILFDHRSGMIHLCAQKIVCDDLLDLIDKNGPMASFRMVFL